MSTETMWSSNKRIKETKETRIDRLSALPDSIIIHILSLIKVKQSAKTAVLSKRWRNFWRESPRLVFREKRGLPETIREFVASVNRILLVVSGGRSVVETFEAEFYYNNIYSFDVDVWFDFVFKNNVKHVSVLLKSTRPSILDFYSLPQMMFHNSSLNCLTLRGCVVAPRRTVKWKSLTQLRIGRVELQQHVVEKILSGCPVLHILWLIFCWGFNCLEVETKSLYKLSVCDREDGPNHNEPSLRISAPHVRDLIVSLRAEERKLILGNTSSLVKVTVGFIGSVWDTFTENVMDNAKEILEKFRHVKKVTMRPGCSQVLSLLAMVGYQFPESVRTHLSVIALTEQRTIHGILGLMESSPRLEELVIEGYFIDEEPSICPDPKGDLNCDLMHLKTITFTNFVHPDFGGEPMLTLARILLKKAPALERMIVNNGVSVTTSAIPALNEPFKIAQTLLSYPRSSTEAVIILN